MSETIGLIFFAMMLLFIASGGLALFLYTKLRVSAARQSRIDLHGDAAHVPLVAAFSGWKGVPWISWSSSTLKPTLVLHPDHIECRVIRTRREPYTAVSRVDYREGVGTNNIVLEFSGSLSSFVGNTASRDLARDGILRLAKQGCPLSPRAEALLNGRSG